MADLVGKKLKDFYVLRRLGRGAMAEVYLAQQLSLGRHVALKVLNADLARDPNYVRRFHHEARAAAALVHAGIVQIYEVGQHDGVHYLAQEYVPGRNLGEVIRSQGTLAPHLTLDILRQVTAALTKASSEGIVHRDIKPENIMLAQSGEVKVADFGLARVQGDGGVNLTQIGVTMGTPLYMSPEQIEGAPLDSRSDIYSLGVTAYHMLSGDPPFTGDSPLAVAVQHLNREPPSLTTTGGTGASYSGTGGSPVPPRLANVVERMMAKKPSDRFNDPAALLIELNLLAQDSAAPGWTGQANQTSLAEILRAADDRAVVTSRLDDLMKTTALSRPTRLPVRWIAAGALGCALLGAAIATFTRPPSLLAGAQIGPPQSDSVWGQLYHAKTADTEDAWLAALNFPNASDYHQNLAKQGLVYCYFRTHDWEKAVRPLEELAELGDKQQTFETFGIAGLVVAFAEMGDDERAYYANQRLSTQMRVRLEEQSPRMAALLESALDLLTSRTL